MTDTVKEQLSACLDGELSEGELDLLLRRLERDPHLRRSIGNYALAGEALRTQRPISASCGFATRVSAAVAAEPDSSRKSGLSSLRLSSSRMSPAALRWLRPASGVAIAAGVAAVAVVSLRPTAIQPQRVAVNQTVPAATADLTAAASYTVPTNPGSTAFVPAARLTNYVVAHSEYSSPLGRRTVLSGVLSDDESEQDDAAVDSTPISAASGPQR